jgi:predicted GNAT family N-acyltransferase
VRLVRTCSTIGYGSGMHARLAESPADRARCLALRRAVFIEEQRVPEDLELDGEDDACTHLVVIDDDGEAVGTARLKLLPEGAVKAQRVAVAAHRRRHGVGRLVMGALEAEARRRGAARVVLSSQVSAIPFYERLGYVASGPVYDDAGIPHRDMTRTLAG